MRSKKIQCPPWRKVKKAFYGNKRRRPFRKGVKP